MTKFSLNRRWVPGLVAAALIASALGVVAAHAADDDGSGTATPIQHLVVIFQENVSFDHYFATYPVAQNPPGEPAFVAKPGTPSVNGLGNPYQTDPPALLVKNQNAVNPFRFDRSHAASCDQDHNYTDEQTALNHGLVDKFVETLGNGPGTDGTLTCNRSDVMAYFDGNTVTALWNYASRFAMSDNSHGTTLGPSTPGALNLISGQTHGADVAELPGDTTQSSVIGDPQPRGDDCDTREVVGMTGRNVGDRLNLKGVTWGWFQGGFRPTSYTASGAAVCGASHIGSNGKPKTDYIPHHEPFQYYASTSNPHHLPPSSVAMIGHNDQANHQYDLEDFWTALNARNLPAVTFLKAPGYQDGHAGYSDPLAEQTFIVTVLNQLQHAPEWRNMAVIIAYDDSDGWYDHAMPPIVQQSNSSADTLSGPGLCGTAKAGEYQARCGYGPRLPLLLVSPWARVNFADHTLTDQSSILRFIEDNWNLDRIGDQSFDAIAGPLNSMFDFRHPVREPLILDPNTGLQVSKSN